MRKSCLVLALAASIGVLSVPVRAAESTATIRLQFVSPVEFDRMLLGPATLTAGDRDARGGLGGMERAIPEGLTSWSVDPIARILTVTGTEKAIEAVRSLVRLVDVSPRVIPLSVRVLPLTAGFRQELGAAAELTAGQLIVFTSGAEGLAAKAAGTPLVDVRLRTPNQQPGRVFWSTGQPGERGIVTLVPRLNGDGSLSLTVPITRVGRGKEGDPVRDESVALWRVRAGESILVAAGGAGVAVLITVGAPEETARPAPAR